MLSDYAIERTERYAATFSDLCPRSVVDMRYHIVLDFLWCLSKCRHRLSFKTGRAIPTVTAFCFAQLINLRKVDGQI